MKPQQILDLEKAWGIEIGENEYGLNDKHEVVFLHLGFKQIGDLNPLFSLSDLRMLDLRGNRISDLNPLSGFKNLVELDIRDNEIKDLNPLSTLSNLTELDLANNRIENIGALFGLNLLTKLCLASNFISDLTPLCQLNNLISLDLDTNQIENVDYLCNLDNLVILSLEKNQIKDLSTLLKLKGLKMLYLDNNQIKNIPHQFIKRGFKFIYESEHITRYTKFVSLYGNPLAPTLIKAIKKSKKAVLEYLDNLEKETAKGEHPLNEAKIIVLGNVGAGKSSLVNYLVGKPFVETKSTQGIRIEHWEIEDASSTTLNNQTKYRINVWDFGGDEIQQTLHRFFLTQDTLYVVVVDARYEEKPNQYLEEIKSYAPNSPVLVVVNRTDQKYWGLDEAQLLSDYRTPSGEPMIKGFFKTSVLKAHKELDPHFLPAINALDAAITQQLLAMPTLRQAVPSNYLEVKSHLESRFFKDMPYISHDLYKQLCRDKNLELASDDALLAILDRLGTVRYFDQTHTRNLHILNPAWLSDGVYRILTATHTQNMRGVISEKDFPRILYKSESHVFDYPKQHYGYLIEMIRQFYLGYLNETSQQIFIPQAFGSDYPDHFRPDDFKTNALHFFFQYETHIPAGAISSFIARKFGQVQGHFYWKNGIVIEKTEADEKQIALVMQTDIKNRIDVWVQGTHRQAFFIEIRQIFREFHERYIALRVDEMVGLDARRNTAVKYRVLIAHKHKGKTDYTDEEGNDYNIDKLLGDIERSADTQRAIYQNFEIKGNYNDMRGASIQFRYEAQAISAEFSNLLAENQSMSQQNKELLNKLIADLNALQKAESPPKAKGILAQLRETVKTLSKIASEEAVKWATKKGLDGVSVKDKFDDLQERLLNLLQDRFQDFIKPDSWA